MNIELRSITKDNYESVCDLDVHKEQEDLVASNMWGLVEQSFNPHYVTRAIYKDDMPVGFFMWIPNHEENPSSVLIQRFMIDKTQQKNGIGRKAIDLALIEIKQSPALKGIQICYDPKNPIAKKFYASCGFIEIGMDEDDDDMIAEIKL